MAGSYAAVHDLTADFILAHQAGRFRRRQVVSHLSNLYRMAQPSIPGDPYFVEGVREAPGATTITGDADTLARRHAIWCTFLANALGVPSPLEAPPLRSLGYELLRFTPQPSGLNGDGARPPERVLA